MAVPDQLLSAASLRTGGILLLALITVAWGGSFVLRVSRGTHPATPLQLRFFRAGHAHAAVLLVLGLVIQPYVDASGLAGLPGVVARSGVPAAALLMSGGFFLSVLGRDVDHPNRWFALTWLGAAALVAGLLVLGVGLLRAG